MTDTRECSDEIDVLDVLVFFAANIRVLVAVPLIIAGLTYGALTLLPEEHTAFYKLELPPSVHPYFTDPIVLAAFGNDGPVKPTMVNGSVTWFFEARSEEEAASAVTIARDAALDAVSDLTPTDIAAEAGGYLGLSEAGVAKQVSIIKRWAEILKKEPVVATSNVKGGLWIATMAVMSFVFTFLLLVVRNVFKSAKMTPEGAEKLKKIRESLALRKR
jgi:hypothetical protein